MGVASYRLSSGESNRPLLLKALTYSVIELVHVKLVHVKLIHVKLVPEASMQGGARTFSVHCVLGHCV